MMEPITRDEIFMATAAGEYSGELPKPVTRSEFYWQKIAQRIDAGGSVSPESIDAAIEDYIDEHGTVNAASFIVEKDDTAYSVKFAVPDGKPALIYDEIEQEE